MGKPQFEDNWKGVFDRAESHVPESLWDKVEMDLVRLENKTNKTRVIYYQRLAAMVALFALMMASYIAYDRASTSSEEAQVAEQKITDSRVDNSNGDLEQKTEKNSSDSDTSLMAQATDTDNSMGKVKPSITGSNMKSMVKATLLANVSGEQSEIQKEGNTNAVTTAANESFFQSEVLAFIPEIPGVEVKIIQQDFYEPNFPRKLPAMPSYLMASNKNERENERVYASLGFAGGSYDPGSVSSSPSNFSSRASQNSFLMAEVEPQSAQATMGTAYSMGVNAGKQISERWVVQSGLGYVVQNINYVSNYSSVGEDNALRATVADYADSETMIAISPPYSIRSINKYLMVPVQVGYKLIDRKIGLQLNAGVSTDFFLSNTLEDESGMTENYKQVAGEGSPYRSINWSGMMGFELSHKLAERYQIALVPGVRYAVNSVLKDDAQVAYNPLILDVGFRVKYTFGK